MDFLLIHGAWHGAWCWQRVGELLRRGGHRAVVPCLPGVGERAGELGPDVDLSCHARALAEVLTSHRGRPLVAVAHSYAGAVLGLAGELLEEPSDRLAGRIFLDASLLEDGEQVMDLVPAEVAQRRIREARSADRFALAPPSGEALGLLDPEHVAYVEARLTPHPLATYLERVQLPGPPGAGPPTAYVRCTDPAYRPMHRSWKRASGYGWPVLDLATGHDAMIADPEATAEMLVQAGAGLAKPSR